MTMLFVDVFAVSSFGLMCVVRAFPVFVLHQYISSIVLSFENCIKLFVHHFPQLCFCCITSFLLIIFSFFCSINLSDWCKCFSYPVRLH